MNIVSPLNLGSEYVVREWFLAEKLFYILLLISLLSIILI